MGIESGRIGWLGVRDNFVELGLAFVVLSLLLSPIGCRGPEAEEPWSSESSGSSGASETHSSAPTPASTLERRTFVVHIRDSDMDTDDIVQVLDFRMQKLFEGTARLIATDAQTVQVLCELPEGKADEIDSAKAAVVRSGVCFFRMLDKERMPGGVAAEVGAELERESMGAVQWLRAPRDSTWPGFIALTPERALRADLQRLSRAQLRNENTAGEVAEAQRRLESIEREDVFTGRDLEYAEVVSDGTDWFVNVRVTENRQDAFEKFTGRHIKEPLALVVDDTVECFSIIRAPLRGRAVIGGRGLGLDHDAALNVATVVLGGELRGTVVVSESAGSEER